MISFISNYCFFIDLCHCASLVIRDIFGRLINRMFQK